MNNEQLSPTEDNLSDAVVAASAEGGGAQMVREQPAAQLFPDSECHDFRARWERIQVNFVDEPRRAVQEADSLVADTMKRLIDNFSGERKRMEAVWVRGDDVSTEDLRVLLQRYRSFFNRLLTL
jgi:hypothetical protein